jgi:hypothetical protein
MSESLLSADRNTHLRMIAVALVAVIAVVSIGIFAGGTNPEMTAGVQADRAALKVGQPATYAEMPGGAPRLRGGPYGQDIGGYRACVCDSDLRRTRRRFEEPHDVPIGGSAPVRPIAGRERRRPLEMRGDARFTAS